MKKFIQDFPVAFKIILFGKDLLFRLNMWTFYQFIPAMVHQGPD